MKKEIKKENNYKLKDDIVYRIVDEEAIIVDIDSGVHYSLNKTATEILVHIDQKKAIKSLITAQVKKYGKDKVLLETNTEGFIKELLQNRIITY